MIMLKTRFIASIIAAFVLFCTQAVYAEDTFKSSDFLEWSEGNKSLYIRTSIGMAGLIAGYNDKKHQRCLEQWYFTDQKKANDEIYETMRKHSEYHPRGIIIAVLKKQCGTFDYSARKNKS